MRLFLVLLLLILTIPFADAQSLGSVQSVKAGEQEVLLMCASGARMRLRAYSDAVIRITIAAKSKDFWADDHYEMVVDHTLKGRFQTQNQGDQVVIRTSTLFITIHKPDASIRFVDTAGHTYLEEKTGLSWGKGLIETQHKIDTAEHFMGLGHQAYGLVPQLDLRGQALGTNYGDYEFSIDPGGWMAQAGLNVPFYMSSKGYGIFVNSTFPNRFSFGKDDWYGFRLDGRGYEAQMDYFFIAGSSLPNVLDRYTQLTGRPRLPQRSMFGLQLSDKDTPDNSGEDWWKKNILEHRAAGFPLDHIVNDNRWRAGSGAWSGSWFEWDKDRYPDPAEYKRWTDSMGLTMTLDLNRNVGSSSMGYLPQYNIRHSECVKENFSVPDYSSGIVRQWVWDLFWEKSLNPKLRYPGDALWMDEIDELICLPDSTPMQNDRRWAEERNYYPFRVAQAVVQEGWDNTNMNQPPGIGEAKRPFMWGRGSTAGAQRYATHWTGDLKSDYAWMRGTIHGMLASGVSGFPYFNHDAGGFRDPGPDDAMYIQWAMAFGSFTPIWRPHGSSGSPRWPLRRSKPCQEAALHYSHTRYGLMPYLYTLAHEAAATGIPMARPMALLYQKEPEAWKFDLQYMWGPSMLVAPQTAGHDSTYSIWLPPGTKWHTYWDTTTYPGGQALKYKARVGEVPVFVKGGAILPKYSYATSTAFQDRSRLFLDVYAGADGQFTVYEDDGVSERYRTHEEHRTIRIEYFNKTKRLLIHKAEGSYKGAPDSMTVSVTFHGLAEPPKSVRINGKEERVKVMSTMISSFANTYDPKTYILQMVHVDSPLQKNIMIMLR